MIMAQAQESSGKVTVKQVRSQARRPREQDATLRGLGLGKIGRSKVLEDTPAIRGMIRKVAHLIEIMEEKS
jgi:large subunit ribosomal protein L30